MNSLLDRLVGRAAVILSGIESYGAFDGPWQPASTVYDADVLPSMVFGR
jgi:hypothetical protein